MGNKVVHFEIGCKDSPATQKFYTSLFDWEVSPMGPAAMISTGEGGIGGHISALGHEPHHYLTFYVEVDDLAAALKKAEELGGKTVIPPQTIPTGSFAWFEDPAGNVVGLWKAAS
jgi:predicted enzyme related to lactoylglutathione lyase